MHRFIVAAILQQLKLIIQVVYPTESYGFFFGGGAIPSSIWRNLLTKGLRVQETRVFRVGEI